MLGKRSRGGRVVPHRKRRRGARRGWLPVVVLGALLAVLVVTDPRVAPDRGMRSFAAHDVRAIDADTIAIGDISIRFNGIAAPEDGHAAFVAGRRALGRLIGDGASVECRLARRTDRYGRRIGRCWAVTAAGARTDLQSAMVRGGHARACPGYGTWRYVVFENARSLALPFPGYCWPGKPVSRRPQVSP